VLLCSIFFSFELGTDESFMENHPEEGPFFLDFLFPTVSVCGHSRATLSLLEPKDWNLLFF